MASAHGARVHATCTLSARMRNASTSMSKRAPRALVVPVRRASQPSTASRTSATVASVTRTGTEPAPARPSTTSAAAPATRPARTRVTWSAGPSSRVRCRRHARASSPSAPRAQAAPVSNAAADSPTARASAASRAACPSAAPAMLDRTVRTLTSVLFGISKTRTNRRYGSRRGRAMTRQQAARAFWLRAPGVGEIRPADLPAPGPEDVLVRTLHTGISRGTETLVFRGGVPESQHAVMRCPFQEGDFPGPVKYGYLNVGVVEEGPADLDGRVVFCLYPHQAAYVVPAAAVVPVPEGVPPSRAVLAGTVETAVNALWDAPPLIGDRVTVVGGGMVGCCVARLLARVPGTEVTLVDVDAGRARVAEALGVRFAAPEGAAGGQDLVVHASATAAGLQRSLELLAPERSVLDLSWYGDAEVALSLGGAFHSARLGLRASQVGRVAPARRESRTPHDRLALALELLRDPAFDALLTGSSPFAELPEVLPALADGRRPALGHVITYEDG